MKPSVIVYGPKACGKTTNGAALAKFFGLETVVELEEVRKGETVPAYGALVLTYTEGKTVGAFSQLLNARAVQFAVAMQEMQGSPDLTLSIRRK